MSAMSKSVVDEIEKDLAVATPRRGVMPVGVEYLAALCRYVKATEELYRSVHAQETNTAVKALEALQSARRELGIGKE